MEGKARYDAGKLGRLAGVVDKTLRQLADMEDKIQSAQLDPGVLEECQIEMEEMTRLLGDSIREALDERRAYA